MYPSKVHKNCQRMLDRLPAYTPQQLFRQVYIMVSGLAQALIYNRIRVKELEKRIEALENGKGRH